MTRWLEIAWSAQGVHEVAGPGAAPEVLGFFKDVDRSDITSDEIAWCAAFAGSCLARSGISMSAIPKSERLMARAYLGVGTPIDAPRMGCLAILTRGDPTAATGHVGFVVGITPTHVALLGGNQANAVNVRSFPRGRVLGYRWPAPPATPQELEAAGSRTVVAARKQASDSAKAGGAQLVPDPVTVGGALGLGHDIDPGAIVAKGQGFKGTIEGAADLATFASAKWPWIMLAVTAYFLARIVWRSDWLRRLRAEEHNTGAHTGRDTLPKLKEMTDDSVG